MPAVEPPDITTQPSRANIERILAYLWTIEAVPGEALDAVAGLLVRAEVAEQRTTGLPAAAGGGDTTVRVEMPPSQRRGYGRQVCLEEIAITCRNCGRTVLHKHYPGAYPSSSCSLECQAVLRRQDAAERQRRRRTRAAAVAPIAADAKGRAEKV